MRHSSDSAPGNVGRSIAAKRGRRSESGDTLIEVLLAIVVLGLASVAIMLAFATSISGSAEHRSLTTFDTVLRSASEEAISQLQQQTASEFGTCPGTYNVTFSLPAGYTAAITQVQYWNGSNFGSVASPNPCVINAPQLITITVTSSTGSVYSISVVVDGPLARPISCATTATQLVFLQIPTAGTSVVGSSFGNQPQVAIEGSGGQYVCNDLSYLTLTLNPISAPNGSNLSGCSGSELGGVVSFSGCSTIGAGTYTLTATDGALTQTSSQFTVLPGLPTQLVFSPSTPGPALAGSPIPNVSVQAEDSYGNVVNVDSDTVTMSIKTGDPQSSFTSGTAAVGMSSGVATFTNLVVDSAGSYNLVATDGSLSQASGAFTVGAAAVSATRSSVNDSPASVTANGTSSSTVTVTLLDAYNNPVSGKSVSLSDGPANSTISSPSGTSNSSGVVTFTVTDTTAESATYTATDTSDGLTIADTAVVTFTAGSVSKSVSTVNQSPSSVPADGATTSTITVTLEDANGNAVPNKTVTLSQGAGLSTISAPSGVSNASGVVTFTVKDTHAQSVTYTATDTTDTIAITDTATVIFYGPASKTLSSVNQSPSSVPADGATTSTITVTLEDANGNAVPNKTVTLSQGAGLSTISAPSGVSNASGVVTFTVKDTHAQSVTYTATDTTDTVTITDTATVVFYGTASSSLSTVNQSPSSVLANGSSTSTITVTLLDANSVPVPNKTVVLSQGVGDSTISAPSGVSNSSGVVTFTVTDSMTQTVTYSAVDVTDGVAITHTAVVTFTPGTVNAANSTVNPTLANVADDGVTTTTVTVTLLDANNNPVPNKTVTLGQGFGQSTILPASGVSNSSGVVTFTVKNTHAQTVTYTATDSTDGITISDTAVVTFYAPLAVSKTLSTVNPSPSSVADDGVTTSTITVTLLDANNNPVPNKTVTLGQGLGQSTILPASGVSNSSGVVTFTVKNTHAQTVTYTATDSTDGITISATAVVTFYAPLAVSKTLSTVNPSVSSVADDGVTTSTITVTLLDSNGNAVPNKTVTLAQGVGLSTISAASGVSNASGVVTFTVKDTNAETVTYTATDTTNSITPNDTAVVTFYTPGTVNTTNSTVIANPVSVSHTSYSVVTVTLEDGNGNAVPNKTVALTTGSGSTVISPASVLTNANGVATFIVSSTKAQSVTYTATDVPDNITVGTVKVTFT